MSRKKMNRTLIACVTGILSASLQVDVNADNSWSLRSNEGPSPRRHPTMAYDSSHGVVVLFGGADLSAYFEDTWEWDGSKWTDVSPPPEQSPTARASHAMAFHGQCGVTVLFGGSDAAGGYLDDTWTWDGVTWTDVSPELPLPNPSTRTGACMAYDSTRGIVLLFGGYGPGGLNDLWQGECEGTGWTWTPVPTTSPKPSPRWGAAMDYDPDLDRTVLFGGSSIPVPCTSGNVHNDTWELDMSTTPATWTLICDGSSCPAPPARQSHRMVYDSDWSRKVMVVFGGTDYCSMAFGDTWEWDGSTWTLVCDGGFCPAPPARNVHAMAYDAAREEVVLFGGGDSYDDPNPLGDTWSYGTYEETAIPSLDIKPGSCPNPFNRNSYGVLEVAVLGTDAFDANQVDPSTVQLSRADGVGGSVSPYEGPPGPHSVDEDVATPYTGEACDCHEEGPDGFMDLSMKFKTDDVVANLGLKDLPAGSLVELVVTGNLLDGTEFSASDCIVLVPPGSPPGLTATSPNVAGAWIAVSPPDVQIDGGGFESFERSYPLGTVVTLTAEPTHNGRRFVGWRLDGAFATTDLSVDVVVTDEMHSFEAVLLWPGDIDGDEDVDLVDFAEFANCFGGGAEAPAGCSAESRAASDLNSDGYVDMNDFATFAANYGASH